MSTIAARTPTEPAFTMPVAGEVLLGKYVIERVLGEGGMGTVVAATHLELGQPVAIKFMLPAIAEREARAERFIREARAAASIRSDHVGRVLDVGSTPSGLPYIVMEYLEGLDLAELMACTSQLPVEEALGYVLEACEAIAEAHARGIVHRDIKPENLFLAERPDGSRIVKVLDFGISKSLTASEQEQAITNPTFSIGSPPYMSPEQVRSPGDVDARTDIWSLGATLYEMLAGQPPFLGDTPAQTLALVLEAQPPRLRDFRPDVPEELEAVVMRCLQKDRTKRYASLDEFSTELAPFASPEAEVSVERVSRLLGRDPPRSRRGPDSLRGVDSLRRGAFASVPSGPPSSRTSLKSVPGATPPGRLEAVTLPAAAEAAPAREGLRDNISASIPVSTTRREAALDRRRGGGRRWVGWAALLLIGGGVATVTVFRDKLPAQVATAAPVTATEPTEPAAPPMPEPPPAVPEPEPAAAAPPEPEPVATASSTAIAPTAGKATAPRPKVAPPPPPRAKTTRPAATAAPTAAPSAAADAWDRGSFGGRR